MNTMFILFVCMMLVTAPSRILPLFFLGDRKLPPFVESLLHYIPFAVLGALIFPDVLAATGDLKSSLSGAIVAFALGWLGQGPLVVLAGGIAGAFLASFL
ncbi:AzlD domain-containing protein [Synergistaceae bacterium OttesenSCG-928-D05]|nr:AzlD domain-containing protein [Synergistaceae bacterium OttesenSCG-928-D05]